jgi:hypothetical protein
MSLDVIADIWGEIRTYVGTQDRADAAESLVSILIDNDYDAVDIRSAFHDADVRRSLETYLVTDDLDDNETDDVDEDY